MSIQEAAAALESSLQAREERDAPTLANSLAATARELERNIIRDQVSHGLTDREERDAPTLANSLAATAHQLERNIIRDNVSHGLADREERDAPTLASSLAGTAHQLERNIIRDNVSFGLRNRQEQDAFLALLAQYGYAPSIANSLAGTARELERNIIRDHVNQGLRDRHTADELIAAGYLRDDVAPRLQSTTSELEQQMLRDQLNKHLETRPDLIELRRAGIISGADFETRLMHSFQNRKQPGSLAPSLASKAKQLEKNLNRDSLVEGLRNRASADQLRQRGLLDDLAPAISGTARALERKIVADQLNHKLAVRPEYYEAHATGYLAPASKKAMRERMALVNALEREAPHGSIANSLAPTAYSLEKQLKRDLLSRNLESREEREAPRLANSLAATAHELERELAHQPTRSDVERQGILRSDVAPSLQARAKELENARLRDQLENFLATRPDLLQLRREGILSGPGFEAALAEAFMNRGDAPHIANSLAATAKSLERQLVSNRLNQSLASREQHEPSTVANSLQGRARELEFQLRRDNFSRQFKPRSEIAEEPTFASPVRRSKVFHLARILFKWIAAMADAGEISQSQKGILKELVVDQDKAIFAVAEIFQSEADLDDFKDSLVTLAQVVRQ